MWHCIVVMLARLRAFQELEGEISLFTVRSALFPKLKPQAPEQQSRV
jgi:hypothetical protein